MCLLLETIRVYNGVPEAMEYHRQRMERSRKALFGISQPVDLFELICRENIPNDGLYKCRVAYGRELHKIEFLQYHPATIRNMKLVNADDLYYDHKYYDRTIFEELKKKNPGYDELIIVQKGRITDTTFTNIALFDGACWITPNRSVLPGTRRQRLIEEGRIFPLPVKDTDLHRYQKISLINAMLDLGDCTVAAGNINMQSPGTTTTTEY